MNAATRPCAYAEWGRAGDKDVGNWKGTGLGACLGGTPPRREDQRYCSDLEVEVASARTTQMVASQLAALGALALTPAPTPWHRAKRHAHDSVVSLCRDILMKGPRQLPADAVHTEPLVGSLPAEFGLRCDGSLGALTPDLVAFDGAAGETLVVEVTIVPDPALPRYRARKRAKYARLCGSPPARPPAIVALGTGGAVPAGTRAAAAALCGTEPGSAESLAFIRQAVEIARARPDAPAQRDAERRGAGGRRRGVPRGQRRRAAAARAGAG